MRIPQDEATAGSSDPTVDEKQGSATRKTYF
jgi:hypothetical protein